MTDLINGRTPEEIKAGLRACTTGKTPGYGCNAHCPYLNVPNCWLPVKADALALIEHLEAQQSKWISVKERLPKYAEVALVYAHHYSGGIAELKGSMRIAMFIPSNRSWKELPDGCAVTHWMPLPSAEGLK